MMTARHIRPLLLAAAGALAMSACTSKPDEVKATGPSELGLSLQVLASPEVLSTDGMSTSQIVVTARGPNSEPKPGVSLRADILVGGARVDYGRLSAKSGATGSDGRATFVYTAPAGGLAGNADARDVVQVAVTPLTGDFQNAVERVVSIRLVPNGNLVFPGQPVAEFSWTPFEPYENDEVTIDGGLSRDCPLDATTPPQCRDTGTLTYEWFMDDRNIQLTGRVIKYQFLRRGDYQVRLTVTNPAGQRHTVTHPINVLARRP